MSKIMETSFETLIVNLPQGGIGCYLTGSTLNTTAAIWTMFIFKFSITFEIGSIATGNHG